MDLKTAKPLNTDPNNIGSLDPINRYTDITGNNGIASAPQLVCLDKDSAECYVITDIAAKYDESKYALKFSQVGQMYWTDRIKKPIR